MRRCYTVLLASILVAPALPAQAKAENRTERMIRQRHELQESLAQAGSQDEAKTLYSAAMTAKLKVSYAESAAPFELSSKAAILDPISGTVLREGSNGWTCIPLRGSPMCLDEQWMAWFDAIRNGSDSLDIDAIGFAYMLAGDQGGPNTSMADAQGGPTADNDWVIAGPHLMLLSPDSSLLQNLPTDPAAGGPFVMWRDTPLAHVMIPIYEGSIVMPYGSASGESSPSSTSDEDRGAPDTI